MTALTGAIAVAFATNGCDSLYWNEQETLKNLADRKEVTVLTMDRPLVYSQRSSSEQFGIDYDLVQSFAKEYNLKVQFKVLKSELEVLQALENGEGDFAALRLRQNDHLQTIERFTPGPAYDDTHTNLYCHRNAKVEHLNDLSGKKIVALNKDLNQEEAQRFQRWAPQTHFTLLERGRVRQLLREVNSGIYDCAVAENLEGEFNLRYFSKIYRITRLTENFTLHWQFNKKSQDLAELSHIWFRKASRRDEISEIRHRYSAILSEVSDRDVRQFVKHLGNTLPEFKSYFVSAGEEHKVPWQLAAAVAYQESHWNAEAVSFTGVRGIMQLTTETAEHLGVTDRTDPEQSIWGGTKYLKLLLDRVPEHLDSKDRLSLALAAYNIGWAHLEDAQGLARQKNMNPYSWMDLKKILPLLEEPSIAETLKYGKARGRETVEFVDRVKGFYNLILLNNH